MVGGWWWWWRVSSRVAESGKWWLAKVKATRAWGGEDDDGEGDDAGGRGEREGRGR